MKTPAAPFLCLNLNFVHREAALHMYLHKAQHLARPFPEEFCGYHITLGPGFEQLYQNFYQSHSRSHDHCALLQPCHLIHLTALRYWSNRTRYLSQTLQLTYLLSTGIQPPKSRHSSLSSHPHTRQREIASRLHRRLRLSKGATPISPF